MPTNKIMIGTTKELSYTAVQNMLRLAVRAAIRTMDADAEVVSVDLEPQDDGVWWATMTIRGDDIATGAVLPAPKVVEEGDEWQQLVR